MSDSALPSPAPKGGVLNDAKILWQMAFHRGSGSTHAERLNDFYANQAEGYDAYRRRLLHGREEMMTSVAGLAPEGGIWVDLGAGTGENAEHVAASGKLPSLSQLYLVDLCTPLLEIGQKRIADRGWTNVTTVEGDATQWVPPEGTADVVTFSYSLTMIPDWFAAVEHAYEILKPGGLIGVADFYVSRKYPAEGRRRHGWLTRTVWHDFFAIDNVFLSPDHLPFLTERFDTVSLKEDFGSLPVVPVLKAPYYVFMGRKGG
ncbi:MAG: class I SAM-dependent methyltransferase [Planctomycetota bacterium]